MVCSSQPRSACSRYSGYAGYTAYAGLVLHPGICSLEVQLLLLQLLTVNALLVVLALGKCAEGWAPYLLGLLNPP